MNEDLSLNAEDGKCSRYISF